MSQSIKARRSLIEGLEKLLETNKATLAADETKHTELINRKASTEAKKREVEDGIVRGLSSDASPGPGPAPSVAEPTARRNGASDSHPSNGAVPVPEPPPMEDLTPPPVESLTPVGSPHPADHASTSVPKTQEHAVHEHPSVLSATQPQSQQQTLVAATATAGADLLSSLSMPPVRHYAGTSLGPGGGSAFKKRKLEADFSGFGAGEDVMADLDADVAELLRAESGGGS